MTSLSLRNYFKSEVNDDENENDAAGYEVNQNKKTTGKSFFLWKWTFTQ